MSARTADRMPPPVLGPGPVRSLRSVIRLIWLYTVSRRLPAALALLAACAAPLRSALYGHWDAYGALQLPLTF
ncbi:MAG TPA: hypothetical protein VFX25_10015, partial [Streptosporangiaceae bacterium]|nr:hypothetical protein [Streptosporangiaceae bacterium]